MNRCGLPHVVQLGMIGTVILAGTVLLWVWRP